MKMLLKMGLRNIGRKKGRTALTVSAVMVCSMGIMIYMVFMSGFIDMMLAGVIDQFGHHRFVHEKVIQKKRLYAGTYFVGDAKRLTQEVKKLPGVVNVAPRINLGAYVDNNGNQAPSSGMGVDPEAEKLAMKLHKKMKFGRMIQSKGKEIVLGERLAKRLKVNVGGSVVLIGQTVDDSLSALRAKVVGISYTGVAQLDKMFFVSIASAQYFLDIPNQLSSLLVFSKNMGTSSQLTKPLKSIKTPKGVAVQNWRNSSAIAKMLPIMDVFVFILGGLIVFIAGIGLMNTMTMSVMERKGEVGVMMALGFTPGKVAGIFLTEGLVLGFIGALLGVALACLLSIPLVTTGVTISGDAMDQMPFQMQKNIKGTITFASIMTGLIVGILSTIAGTIWPALQASRLEPVDALREG